MTVYIVLLAITAFFAYVLGSMKTVVIASNFVFHRSLSRLGAGTVWFSNFKRIYGVKGLILYSLVELARDMIPILIGSLLLGFRGYAVVGRAFAGFCLVLGGVFPLFYRFRGGNGLVCLVLAAAAVNVSLGVAAAAVAAVTFWFSRYLSLSAVAAALTLILASVLVIDDRIVMVLCIFMALLVLLRQSPAIARLLHGREQKTRMEEDITYKLDQKF